MPQAANIWYKDYDRSAYGAMQNDRNDSDVVSYSGLSTFQIPSTVTIEVRSDSYVAFKFAYPNEERAEQAERCMGAIGDAPNLHFLLGNRTRKILEVRFTRAGDRVRDKDFSFDPTCPTWINDVSSSESRAIRLNTALIAEILRNMPSDIFQQIRSRLRDLQNHK